MVDNFVIKCDECSEETEHVVCDECGHTIIGNWWIPKHNT